MPEFDSYSSKYSEILNRSVNISGESSEYFAEYKARYLSQLLGRSFAGKCLDFGCGIGSLSLFLARHLPRVELDGYDISSASIAVVPEEVTAKGLFTSDINDIGTAYALIVVANVMHHVAPSERQEFVVELTKRLAPGGKIAIFEHNPANPMTRRVVDQCPFDENAVLLAAGETRTLLEGAGLILDRRDYIVFFPQMLSWLRSLEPLLSWLPMGAQYVVVGVEHD